jgi:hypothetical protein
VSVTELVVGRRYWLAMQPWGACLVEFLGPVPFWPRKARVQNPVTRRTCWVNAERLKACVEEVHT